MSNRDYTSDTMLHIKDNGVEYLQFRKLKEYSDKLKHACTLKYGGAGDSGLLTFRREGPIGKKYAYENLSRVCSKLELSVDDMCKGRQVHSDNILILNQNNKERYLYKNLNLEEYDGYITNEKDIGSVVITADCNPVILYDPIMNVVANVHSGWKGTIEQIYLKAIRIMHDKFNSKYEDVIVCVGPAINKCCFCSKDIEFKNKFLNVWPDENEYIETKADGTFYINLQYVIKKDLLEIGVKEENIVFSNICTMCNSDDFFSYRVYKQNDIQDYETMATVAQLI